MFENKPPLHDADHRLATVKLQEQGSFHVKYYECRQAKPLGNQVPNAISTRCSPGTSSEFSGASDLR